MATPRSADKDTDEQVLAVPRTRAFGGAWPQGFHAAGEGLVAALEREARFLPRPAAEQDPEHKQLIPYCVVVRGAELLCVERLAAQGEARLHGLRSIGIGGHVNLPDGPAPGAARRALVRELHEELAGLPAGIHGRFLGLLNDDSTAVGSVHAGLVYRLDVAEDQPPPRVRETRKMAGRFRPLAVLRAAAALPEGTQRVVESAKLWQHRGRFETWSTLLLEAWPWSHPGHAVEGSDGTDCN